MPTWRILVRDEVVEPPPGSSDHPCYVIHVEASSGTSTAPAIRASFSPLPSRPLAYACERQVRKLFSDFVSYHRDLTVLDCNLPKLACSPPLDDDQVLCSACSTLPRTDLIRSARLLAAGSQLMLPICTRCTVICRIRACLATDADHRVIFRPR